MKPKPKDLDLQKSSNEIEFLDGRPKRDRAINKEDIDNLIIALNTATTEEEFFALV